MGKANIVQFDELTGDWLAHCSACPVPKIANVFKRTGIPFHQVTGVLEGHYYNGMLDIASDTTRQIATFGGHIEIVEVEELAALRRGVSDAEEKGRVSEFRRIFDVQPDCLEAELIRAARTSLALDKLSIFLPGVLLI